MKANPIISFLLLAALFGSAAFHVDGQEDKAREWFNSVSTNFLKPNLSDTTPPTITLATVVPSFLKLGDPVAEISANVYDPAGIRMVYALVGNRMHLMMDMGGTNEYTGYCGSNLPPGSYKVVIIAVDKAGNAAQAQAATNLTILDPNLNVDHIENSLENRIDEELRVIVLHDANLSIPCGERFKIIPASSAIVPGTKLEDLAQMKGINGIYEDKKLKVLSSLGGDSLPARGIDDPRKGHSLKGDGVAVALLDTGADPQHQALKGDKIIAFKDLVNNKSSPYDDNGHGTHCADLIAGDGNEDGVAPNAKLVVVKVMNKDGECYFSDALKALDWVLENKDKYGIRVVSFSVGGEGPEDGNSLLDQACNNLVDKGLLMCVAAGNSGPAPKSIVVPGGADKVITVGAIDNRGSIFDRSSRGPAPNGGIKPDIVTLGVDVVSALSGTKNEYGSLSGTSMAVPQVSGAAALLFEAKPDLKPADVKRILLKTADNLSEHLPNYIYGYGAMNLTSALDELGAQPDWLAGAKLLSVDLNRYNAMVGDSVMINAKVSGDVKEVNSQIIGPTETMEIPLADFDANGIYSAPWETSLWKPGDYTIEVDLNGLYGETESSSVSFHLDAKR